MTDMDECSCPGTTDSRPMKRGRLFRALKYSTIGYWNSCTDCQRHMLRAGLVPDTSPLGVTPEFSHVVVGPRAATNGYAGVDSVASSTSEQLRLPLPP